MSRRNIRGDIYESTPPVEGIRSNRIFIKSAVYLVTDLYQEPITLAWLLPVHFGKTFRLTLKDVRSKIFYLIDFFETCTY